MHAPRWVALAGVAAIIGGITAIVLTMPFAIAYHTAYPGFDVPPYWISAAGAALRPVISFAAPSVVYDVYGRVFDLVYLLFLPATFALHRLHRGATSTIERAGFVTLAVGLLVTFVGVAGDYWADGALFVMSVLGLLTIGVGAVVYGVAMLQRAVLPGWLGWLLIGCLPGAFIVTWIIGHIPSGPTVPFAAFFLALGYVLVFRRDTLPTDKPAL